MEDHDQRFKTLLQEFFREFFLLFFPRWEERFDFTAITWLNQEVFADPPQGERRELDLVAQLATRQAVAAQRSQEAESWVVLVHVEIESADSVASFRPRMYDYYSHLRRKYRAPVLPVGLYLRVGLEGVGIDVYEEHFWELRPLHFQYLYGGLPRLDALPHLNGDNWLGVAFSALMKIPGDRRAWFKAEALRRLVGSPENAMRRFLLCECVQAYLPLEPPELREFEHLLITPPYQEVRHVQTTWYEQGLQEGQREGLQKQATWYEQGLQKGREEGREEVRHAQATWYEQGRQEGLQKGRHEGLQESRKIIQGLLEARFGSLDSASLQRLESWPADRLSELGRAALQAQSLQELGLVD